LIQVAANNQADPQVNNQAPQAQPQIAANQANQQNIPPFDPNVIVLQNRPASAPTTPQGPGPLRSLQGVPFFGRNNNNHNQHRCKL